MSATIIIITGLPATGKTTIGKKIAENFNIPFLSKDYYKELLFDVVGYRDRELSRKYGAAAYKLMMSQAKDLLRSGQNFIMESNFKSGRDEELIKELAINHAFNTYQLLCHTDGQTLLERFVNRSGLSERHLGHADLNNLEEYTPILLAGKCLPLQLNCETLEIDTTDWAKVNTSEIMKKLETIFA
jgi:predicted kinase